MWVLGAFADGCGCFLTFLVALDYWLCVTLEWEMVFGEDARGISIAHLKC